MIDTSKYDGHTPGTWTVDPGFDNSPDYTDIREKDGPTIIASIVLNDSHWDLELQNEMSANARLIADAPLLLAESSDCVKDWMYLAHHSTTQAVTPTSGIGKGITPESM